MRLITVVLAFFLVGSLPVAVARDSDQVLVQGVLVLASNKPGATDARIAPYEPNLKRVLRFESYKSAGEGTASLAVPGTATISLGRGHKLELEGVGSDGNQVRIRVKWVDGKRQVMDTTLRLFRGTPAVLGGPAGEGGEVLAILVLVL